MQSFPAGFWETSSSAQKLYSPAKLPATEMESLIHRIYTSGYFTVFTHSWKHTFRVIFQFMFCALLLETTLLGHLYLKSASYLSTACFLKNDEQPDLLEDVLSLHQVTAGLQQGGTRHHIGRLVTAFPSQHFQNYWIKQQGAWLLRSPDLTSLGCYLWGYMKSLLNTVKLSTHG